MFSSECTKVCPSRMADGRQFTDYRPQCILEHEMSKKFSKTPSSYDRRQFMIHNAEDIMAQNRATAMKQFNCFVNCKEPYGVGTMLPEKYTQTCDKDGCKIKLTNPNGLGIGRKYVDYQYDCHHQPFEELSGGNCCQHDRLSRNEATSFDNDLRSYQHAPVNPIPYNLK